MCALPAHLWEDSPPAPNLPAQLRGLNDQDKSRIQFVFNHLTADGKKVFLEEVLTARKRRRSKDQAVAVSKVIRGWYRTTIIRTDPRYIERMERAQAEPPGRYRMTLDEVQARLDL